MYKASLFNMKKVLFSIALLLVVYFLYTMSSIYLYSFKSSPNTRDAAIVLGAAVWDEKPSPVFEERIKHALKLYHAKQVKLLIFTGGVGVDDVISEGLVAKEYAIKHSVPEADILIEDKSTLTFENLKFTSTLLTQQNISSVLLVSDPLHMKRSMTMAEDLGINALPSPTQTSRYQTYHSKSKMLFSETVYLIGYAINRFF